MGKSNPGAAALSLPPTTRLCLDFSFSSCWDLAFASALCGPVLGSPWGVDSSALLWKTLVLFSILFLPVAWLGLGALAWYCCDSHEMSPPTVIERHLGPILGSSRERKGVDALENITAVFTKVESLKEDLER